MSAFNIFATLIAILSVLWAIWFLVGLVRYSRSGDYDVDKRLQKVSQ